MSTADEGRPRSARRDSLAKARTTVNAARAARKNQCLPETWRSEVAPTSATARMAPAIIVALGVLMATAIAVRHAAAESREELLQQASALNAQAGELYEQGRYAEAEPLLTRALGIREKVLPSEDRDIAQSLNNLAELYDQEARYAEAESLLTRALANNEKALPERPADVAAILNNLGGLYHDEGRYAEAERLHKRALAIREKVLPPEHRDIARSLVELADAYSEQGRYAEAEPLLTRALGIWDKALPERPAEVAASLNNLAGLYEKEGRYAEAEPFYKRALGIMEKVLPSEHADTARTLNNLGLLYYDEGRYAEAERLHKRALAIRDKVLPPEHPEVAESLNNLAMVYDHEGRYAEAKSLLTRALAIDEKALPEHLEVSFRLTNLANIYFEEGRYAEAERGLMRALAIREKVLGPRHPEVAQSLNDLAHVYAVDGKLSQAREDYEQARRVTLEVERGNQGLDEKTLASLARNGTQYLPDYAELLAGIVRDPKLDSTLPAPDAEVLTFVVAEQARGTMAQAALAKAAMRAATDDPATADLARQVQDLGNQCAAIAKQLDAEYAKPPDQQNADRLRNLQQRSQNLERQLATASERLSKACPRCGELTVPEPISSADTQKLLRSGEALISYLTLDDRVLAWAVRRDAPISYRDTPVERADLNAMVARVRASLNNRDRAYDKYRPYDVADAFALEKLLLKPFAKDLAGMKHLIIVPDDPLLPVPFAALVVDDQGSDYAALAEAYRKGLAPSPAELRDEYPRIAWLSRNDFTISELPSATSLRALRGTAKQSTAQNGLMEVARGEPFIGVGDPVLRGMAGARGGAMLPTRGAGSIDDIRNLPRLPGTRDELIADARALGADPNSSLFLGNDATKPKVMELNRERLAGARVVAFATHALIGGDVTGLKEPALVLTPPNQMSESDDGLLELEDVMGLKLKRSEWVVLSACNTAAPGGSVEGFSGLTRAFFYAGTPSLLVSQWSVDDAATDQLMTAVFTAYGRGAGVSRATALHDAMLKLIEVPRTDPAHAYFAHPYAWAPFIVVGEGSASP